MRTTSITCDQCGADLNVINASDGNYRVALDLEWREFGDSSTRSIQPPWPMREHHFCNLRCLMTWGRRQDAKTEARDEA